MTEQEDAKNLYYRVLATFAYIKGYPVTQAPCGTPGFSMPLSVAIDKVVESGVATREEIAKANDSIEVAPWKLL